MAIVTPTKRSAGSRTATATTSTRTPTQTVSSIGAGFALAAIVYVVALVVHGSEHSSYRISEEWSAFAGLFVLALAIERLLEPITKWLGPDTDVLKKQRDDAAAAAANGDATKIAEAEADLSRGRELTAIVVWGAATALGFVLSSVLDITLLEAIRSETSGQPPFWADLLVTGLVLGAGTKPLHDLVSKLQKSKD